MENNQCSLEWNEISKFPHCTEFLLQFKDNLNWKLLSQYHKFTTEELGMFHSKVDWDTVSWCQSLNEDYFNLYASFLNWTLVSLHQYLPESTIIKFKDRIDWEAIFKRKDIRDEFKRSNYNTFKKYYQTKYVVSEVPYLDEYLSYQTV